MINDISVIIPTYNRAGELAKTLRRMVAAEKSDFSVKFVIVDNGSTDQTKSVVELFSNKLTVQYLFEPKSGKNRALNCALENIELGKIVVFTDDDVDVSPNWLVSIRSVCDRWPKHSVFGGRINVVFPNKKVPKWAFDQQIASLAFAYHDYSDKECVYKGGALPFGPNYWLRREILSNGRRFDEAIGPHPTNRMLGDETLFLKGFLNDGYEIVFSPAVVVGHRIQSEILKFSAVCLRAYKLGRGVAHIQGMPHQTFLRQHPVLWFVNRGCAVIYNAFRIFSPAILWKDKRFRVNCIRRFAAIGFQIEAICLAKAP